MRYIAGEARIVWSASDLKAAAECEFAWLRRIDAKLDRVEPVDEPEDAMLARAARLGTAHEERVLEKYRAGGGVVEIPPVSASDAEALAAAVAETERALHDPAARVVYQAAFATSEFVGFADFLVRDPDGAWIVQDTKLARRAKVTALMQLAAYADQLDRLGVPRADRVELLLGDGTTATHPARDVLPVFGLRRERLRALIADRDLKAGAAGAPIAWGDERGELRVFACGRCTTCEAEVVRHGDLLLVAGMRPTQRRRLRDARIETIDALAAATPADAPEGMARDTFVSLQTQAALQLESDPEAGAAPVYRVIAPHVLAGLPRRDPGDIFFDFEGDPLYSERDETAAGARTQWGLDYLFGWVDNAERYTALWAHTFADERETFETFIDLVTLRRGEHPGMHIYHYAPYETTHLLAMAARYGTREAELDTLLRDGVFVDLYPLVRQAVRVGSRSYSIKKLEPLYMGAQVRTAQVQRGDESIERYTEAMQLREAGAEAEASVILDDLADYNRYDCVSTLRLRDWLVDRARESGLVPAPDPAEEQHRYEPSARAVLLTRMAGERTDASDDAAAETLRIAAAAIDYFPREAKTFWAAHFQRHREPLSLWHETRDVVSVDPELSGVDEDWHTPPRARRARRILRLRGELAPGTKLPNDGDVFLVYERPAPFAAVASPRFINLARGARIIERLDDGAIVQENATPGGEEWDVLPIAIVPGAPPNTAALQAAIDAWADDLIDAGAPGGGIDFPRGAATDLLRRVPPRLTDATTLPRTGDDVADITAALRVLDDSYLAVQGPPGTGKTYVGSHVIARLVTEHHWRVGVVAQSHAVVEHMLEKIVEAGVPPELVGKPPKRGEAPKTDAEPAPFTAVAKDAMAAFVAERTATGAVIGGTAWDIAHPERVPRGGLDLLVIDEAGQFSLASTIAVSLAAPRLLLLGDPQQLPQVSQGSHPAPVDAAALGWVMGDRDVIDPAHGYFLERSWRMHPRVARAVSALSYDGRLRAHPITETRSLEGVEPGVEARAVAHTGNTTSSVEEAAVVVEIVRGLLGRAWDDGSGPRPLEASDLIVVTPYNAQLVEVEEAFLAAGIEGVPVGTVDKFQGREAAVAIVTLAASSGRSAPRGLEFLLLQNRLNVAVSRAKWRAIVLYSPALLDDLPHTPEGVARLSAFARLVGRDETVRGGLERAQPVP